MPPKRKGSRRERGRSRSAMGFSIRKEKKKGSSGMTLNGIKSNPTHTHEMFSRLFEIKKEK
jgi:hypothetical protein